MQILLSRKTRFLNFFRRIFTMPVFERLLLKLTIDTKYNSIWARTTPPNYLYPKNSYRNATRNNIHYHLDISDYMEHGVYFGFREPAQDTLFDLAKDKKTVIDVGVNLGSTMLNFARLGATVVGLEPDKKNFDKATRNASLNRFTNIRLINQGAGAEKSTAKLYKVNKGNEGMNRILLDGNGEFELISILPLDDMNIPADLIKIDVEGYEFEVLKGAKRLLSTYHPALFIEIDEANLNAQGSSPTEVLDYLESLGYQCYRAEGGDVGDTKGCHFDVVAISSYPLSGTF